MPDSQSKMSLYICDEVRGGEEQESDGGEEERLESIKGVIGCR